MALKVYASIQANGTNIEGDSPARGGRTIEITELSSGVTRQFDKDSGQLKGGRSHKPVTFIFPIIQGSPLFFAAIAENHNMEVDAAFFRPNPDTGAEEHFYTLQLTGARCVNVEHILPDTYDPETANVPPMMKVEMTAQSYIWRHEVASTEAQDDWAAQR